MDHGRKLSMCNNRIPRQSSSPTDRSPYSRVLVPVIVFSFTPDLLVRGKKLVLAGPLRRERKGTEQSSPKPAKIGQMDQ